MVQVSLTRFFAHFLFSRTFPYTFAGRSFLFFYYSFPAFLFCGVTLWFLCAPCGFSCVCSVRSRCDWRLVFKSTVRRKVERPGFYIVHRNQQVLVKLVSTRLINSYGVSVASPPTCHHPAPPHPSPAPSASSFWVSLLVLVSVLGLGWVLVWFVYGFGYWFWLWYGYRSRCLCRRCVV